MSTITIVTAADNKFKLCVENLIRSVESKGYSYLLYDIGNLGCGKKFSSKVSNKSFQKFPQKPKIILDALDQVSDKDFLVWLDADTMLVDKIDEIINEYDIGITIRTTKDNNRKAGTINSGVIFVRNTNKSKQFLQKWAEHSLRCNGDQWSLNEMCSFPIEETNNTKHIHGAIIKGFPCLIYNNFYFTTEQINVAKIVHYKGQHKHIDKQIICG
jgi:hypothetical protein